MLRVRRAIGAALSTSRRGGIQIARRPAGARGIAGLASYEAALASNPLATKCATGGLLAFLGDAIAQSVQEGDFDGRRLAAFSIFGVGWTGFVNHYWFGYLATVIPGTTPTAVVGKVVVQHLFYNPILYLPTFYAFNGVFTGLSKDAIVSKAKNEYWPTLTKLWTIWVPSTTIQFFFVPTRLQVLYVAGVSFGWNVLLSVSYNAREFNDQFKAPAAAPPSTAGVMVDQEASEQQEDGPELQAALSDVAAKLKTIETTLCGRQ